MSFVTNSKKKKKHTIIFSLAAASNYIPPPLPTPRTSRLLLSAPVLHLKKNVMIMIVMIHTRKWEQTSSCLQWTSTMITTKDSPLKKCSFSAPFAFLIVPFEFSRQDVLHTLENGLVFS